MEFILEKENYIKKINESDIIEEGLGEWLFKAPKVRKLQKKANDIRMQAAKAEYEQKSKIEDAMKRGKSPDVRNMWKLLQDKLDAWEDTAREYEQEAMAIAGGSAYLQKVQRVTRFKGQIEINKVRIQYASKAEVEELDKKNSELKRKVEDYESEIMDKIKSDKEKMSSEKKSEYDKLVNLKKSQIDRKLQQKDDTPVDAQDVYFDSRKANKMRQK